MQQNQEIDLGERFLVRRCLGSGGMGIVYEAFDRAMAMRVAVKTLRLQDATAIYRFKKEFRALSEVTHPNLVSLYELVHEAPHLFFTMELVEGLDFLQHLTFGVQAAYGD